MVLTILSLIVGYLTLSINVALLFTTGAVTGQDIDSGFLAFAAVCSLGFATLSGWLAALVAQRAPIFHAGLLSFLLLVVWAISTFASAPADPSMAEPLSVSLLNIAVGVTGVMTGGWLRLRQMKAKDAAEENA
ncbi:MAG: hypothetical protein AAGB19_23340 [Cyanobacteria bacterium P01_F01_bin.3]|mgnify:CR=1 FL=1